jgi:hypothetical protein
MILSDTLLSGKVKILILVSVMLFVLNLSVYEVDAQQGGAATGGDATTGGVIMHCTSVGACTITQAPRGGEATGGNAAASFVEGQSMDNLTLSNVSIPISSGFVDGKVANFIATDASTQEVASSVSNTTGFKVSYTPTLADTSDSDRQQFFVFLNGFSGEEGGPLGSQLSVGSAVPGDSDYSPLFDINYVQWNTNNSNDIRVLRSADEIFEAQENGELTITKSNVVINSPAIVK